MPKKQKQRFNFVSSCSNYVHPSLAVKSGPSHSEADAKTPASVNARIQHLRRTQGFSGETLESKGLYASQHASLPSGRREAAGPPPPRSWVVGSDSAPYAVSDIDSFDQQRPRLSRLPGVDTPLRGSLLDLGLRSMARNFDWHVAFDHLFLSTLPVELRSQLLSYIAVHNARGLSRQGLEMLFAQPSVSGFNENIGSADVTRLDLARSVGRSLALTDLQGVWRRRRRQRQNGVAREELLNSWDDDDDRSLSSLSLESSLQFPRLTHLSLSHPTRTVSWQDLIIFSKSLGSLTHLCLDFWPRPYLPDMQLAPTYQHESILNNPIAGTSQAKEKEQEAAIILRALSRNTPALRWVSFAGCQAWYDALLPQDNDPVPKLADERLETRSRDLENVLAGSSRRNRLARLEEENMSMKAHEYGRGPDWNGHWRQVCYVHVGQDWIPPGLKSDDLAKLVIPRKARSANREALRAEPFQLPQDHETYRLSSGSDEVHRSIEEGLQRRRWLLLERMSILLASKVDWKRVTGGLPTAEFDFGWGRQELLEAGYEEQVVFDAGL